MKNIILASSFLFLALGNAVNAQEEFFLECNGGHYNYFNEKKNLGGEVYKKEENKELHIYDWIFSNVKFTDKKITYNWKGFDAYKFYPSFERYNKEEIDRYSGEVTFFKKNKYLLDDYFPEFVQKKLGNFAWLFQFWKKEKYTSYCTKITFNNYKKTFITEKYWNDNIKEKVNQDGNKFRKF